MLVHCVAGVSRSASLVQAYLMRKHRLGAAEALARLRAARPVVNPHAGFRLQLSLFEKAGWSWEGWPGWDLDTFLR